MEKVCYFDIRLCGKKKKNALWKYSHTSNENKRYEF